MSDVDMGQGSAEDHLIARFFKPLATHPGAFGLEDDAATFMPPQGCDVVATTDGLIAGIHFLADQPADLLARKALRVNLSDLAAKGATPIGFLLSIALPANVDASWLAEFARGLGSDARDFGCALLGGDTDRTTGPLSISIAAFGSVPHGRMVRRRGAQPGDRLFVSGSIGDGALGLRLARDPDEASRLGLAPTDRDFLIDRYRLPRPRTALTEALRAHASAALDVSDGLAGDLAKLCRVSGVGSRIAASRVPLSDAARAVLAAEPALLETALSGGDDYEILAAVPPAQAEAFRAAAAAAALAVTDLGVLTEAAGVTITGPDERPMTFTRPSFSHF